MAEMMPAREMNERVAGLIGARLEPPCPHYHCTDEAEFDSVDGVWYGWCYTCGRSIREVEPRARRYSTDIAAAWEAVEAMRSRGFRVMLDASAAVPFGADDRGWECMVEKGRAFETATASTAPLAICRAILATLTPEPR